MEYAFSCGFFDIFLYFQHCFGGKGGAEVVVFKKTNKKRKVQRKMLGVPSNFGSDCSCLIVTLFRIGAVLSKRSLV